MTEKEQREYLTSDRYKETSQLQRKAREYQDAMRKQMENQYGVNNPRSGYRQGLTPPPRSPGYQDYLDRTGAFTHEYGRAPNDQEVAKYIEHQGGNPYTKKLKELGERYKQISNQKASAEVAAQAQKQVKATQDREAKRLRREQKREAEEREQNYQDFLADVQSKYDEANAANEERYSDILGRLEDRYSRNMDRVDNYGKAASADIEERFDESLGNQLANLSGRGFGSSNIGASLEARNDRDRTREQQRLSEMVDSRSAEYDQKLSNDVAMFMERRNDVQPNLSELTRLAQQYGLSNEGRGFNAEQTLPSVAAPAQPAPPAYQPQQPQYQQQPAGVSAGRAGQIAAATQSMLSPLVNNGYAANFMAPINNLFSGTQRGITSNRGVVNRHATGALDRAAYNAATNKTMANIPDGYGDGRGGAGPQNIPSGYYPQNIPNGYYPQNIPAGYYPQNRSGGNTAPVSSVDYNPLQLPYNLA